MWFKFQVSQQWDNDNLDPNGEVLRVSAPSIERARKRLPPAPVGTFWVEVPDNGESTPHV